LLREQTTKDENKVKGVLSNYYRKLVEGIAIVV
jgi:hypothetical protein